MHVARQELDAAVADFDRAISLRPEFAFAYLSRGVAARRSGNLDRAVADFDHAIALAPGMADAFAARGDAFRAKGDLDKAILDFTRAIAITPKASKYFSGRGDVFSAKGDLDRAIADYDQALALAPDDRHIRDMKAFALKAKADLSRATAEAASPSAPAGSSSGEKANSAPSIQQLVSQASLLMSQKKLDEAIAILNKAVATDARSSDSLRLRAIAWLQKGQFVQALTDSDSVVRLTPTNPNAYSARG